MPVEKEFSVMRDDAALFGKLLTNGVSSEASHWILKLEFPEEWERDAEELAEKKQAGKVTLDDLHRLDNYIHVGDLLGLLQSEARAVISKRGSQGSKDL
jgi:hypothetical protein